MVLEESRPDVNANWAATTASAIPLAATQITPLTASGQVCPQQQYGSIDFPRCGSVRRFSVTQACYTDDAACNLAFPKPVDVPPAFSCPLACANDEPTCNTIQFGNLSAAQQAEVRNLRTLMQVAPLPLTFNFTTVVQALASFSCPSPRRGDIAANGSVLSVGDQCDVTFLSAPLRYPDPSIKITSLDAHFPHLIDGTLARSTYGSSFLRLARVAFAYLP